MIEAILKISVDGFEENPVRMWGEGVAFLLQSNPSRKHHCRSHRKKR